MDATNQSRYTTLCDDEPVPRDRSWLTKAELNEAVMLCAYLEAPVKLGVPMDKFVSETQQLKKSVAPEQFSAIMGAVRRMHDCQRTAGDDAILPELELIMDQKGTVKRAFVSKDPRADAAAGQSQSGYIDALTTPVHEIRTSDRVRELIQENRLRKNI